MPQENNKIKYPIGIEWRKWDLQACTKHYCNYKGPSFSATQLNKLQSLTRLPKEKINTDHVNLTDEDYASLYVEYLLHFSDIEVLAITNHNCGKGIQAIMNYLASKQDGSSDNIYNRLNIFPGVEVTTSDKCHVLVIFNPKTTNKNKFNYDKNGNITKELTYDEYIENFLSKIEIPLRRFDREKPASSRKYSCEELLDLHIDWDFIPVFPHVNDRGGWYKELPESNRKEVFNHEIFGIVDIKNASGNTDLIRIFNGKNSDYGEKVVAQIFTSDAKSITEIGKYFTWIKADPIFEGLKQILYEPKLRVSLGERCELYLYPQIISVQLQGAEKYQTIKDKEDFPPITLQEQIWFNPNLTTIIGPRASGKTVLVELLSYPFNKHLIEVKKEEKLPLIQFLAEKFPNLKVTVSYRQGEQEPRIIERKIEDLSDPFYVSPLNIEYWRQGQIEEVADKKEKITEYIEDRLKSRQLLNLSQEIEKLKAKLEKLRTTICFDKFETEIEQRKLLAERKQLEEYFEKLKTQEYRELIKNIRENRAKNQILESFIESLESITVSLEEFQKKSAFINIPEKDRVLGLFLNNSILRQKIGEFYKFLEMDLIQVIKRLKKLKELIRKSKEKTDLQKEASELKSKFLAYCEKNGIKITQTEYEMRTNRVGIINQKLREVEAKLNEYKESKKIHAQLAQELKEKLFQWRQENKRIIEEFNEMYLKSNVRVFWEDPITQLSEWLKKQFLTSDSCTKASIEKHYHILSPRREDFIREITKELVSDKKYSLEEIIDYLQNKKVPPLEKSGSKEENLKWFFQRDETAILREDLIMRLQEYGEKGINLIQYKKKTLGKDTMSYGERCGTILELILHSGDHPLVIDQPEEHLDSKFITNRIVDIIRKQKINRQIIICTHNANIVVLGDSELVTVLSVDAKGTCGSQGSLENSNIRGQICNVLEGGPEAFKKREQKYGFK